jgi:hypothetical protein
MSRPDFWFEVQTGQVYWVLPQAPSNFARLEVPAIAFRIVQEALRVSRPGSGGLVYPPSFMAFLRPLAVTERPPGVEGELVRRVRDSMAGVPGSKLPVRLVLELEVCGFRYPDLAALFGAAGVDLPAFESLMADLDEQPWLTRSGA